MSSTHLWDWPGPHWTSARALPSNGCACQKDGRHDSSLLSPGGAPSCPEPPPPPTLSVTMPPSQLPPLPPLARHHESLTTTQPGGLSPLISLTLKERKGTTLFKSICNVFLDFCFSCFLFAECVCVLYILTLYKPVGCCNGSLGGSVLVGWDQGVFLLGNYA